MSERPKFYSIGNNCEVGLQLRRMGLMESDDFFIWHATPFATLTKLIDAEFVDVGADEHLDRSGPETGMIQERYYGLEMHTPFVVNGIDQFRSSDHSRIYRFFSADLKRRATAFLRHLREGNVIYVCKYQDHTPFEDASALAQLLREKAGHDRFSVAFVQERRAQGTDWSAPNVFPFYVESFAPWERTVEFDTASWNSVFQQIATTIEGAATAITSIVSDVFDDAFYEANKRISTAAAEVIVPELMRIVDAKAVCDVGCGNGSWLAVIRQHGAERILGIDGAYVPKRQRLVPESCFLEQDLTQPLSLDERFDLSVCLEVAEHLPEKYSESLIKMLISLAPVCLFSAAIPGQGGDNHLNEQWQSYWGYIFGCFGFQPIDCIRPLVWRDKRVAPSYQQSILLYANAEAGKRIKGRLGLEPRVTLAPGFDIVHPDIFLTAVNKLKL